MILKLKAASISRLPMCSCFFLSMRKYGTHPPIRTIDSLYSPNIVINSTNTDKQASTSFLG